MDGGAWWAPVHGVAKSWAWLSEHTHLIHISSVLSPNAPFLEEGDGTPLQYSCLENPMDGGAWWATAHRVTKSQDTTERLNFNFNGLLKWVSPLAQW